MDDLKIYLLLNGNNLVAQEIRSEGGKRIVKGAAYLEVHPSGVRFNFSQVRFFEPTSEFTLYESAFIGEQPMPLMIAEQFKLYMKHLEVEAEKLRKQLEATKA